MTRDPGFEALVSPQARAQSALSGYDESYVQPAVTQQLTRIDAWWGRMLGTPLRQRLWYWGGPILVTLIAAVVRLWHLGNPHTLVFDETFYVKDAWTLMHEGYEASWPANADTGFAAGDVNTYSDSAAFIAHPPLGKWVISLGLAVFGAQDTIGWRISTAVVGILAVFVLMMVARTLTRSTMLAVIAGLLFAIDGHAIVLSRTALLDNFVMFFSLLGVWAVLADREQSRGRLELWLARRRAAGRSTDWGPSLWARPWLITAGLLFGATAAVKWSGVYFLAVFALYTVVVDAVARRRAGIAFWATSALLKQAPVTFVLMVPIALGTYLASWTGWYITKGGYDRGWANLPGNAATGFFAWVPRTVQSFWHFQGEIYGFNINEHTPHPYQANPFTWLFLTRPTAFYYQAIGQGSDGCTSAGGCASYITSIANPVLWWAATAAIFYLVYRLVRYREWQVGLILTGMLAGYVPWLLYAQRTIFQFYAIAFEPYMILGLVWVIGLILGSRYDPVWRRISGIRLVAIFLGLVVLVSIFFYPVWTGDVIPVWYAQLHYWLPGWR